MQSQSKRENETMSNRSGLGRRQILAVGTLGAAAATFGTGLIARSARAADTTIRWLHLEVNPRILKIWNNAAQEYEKSHPGVQVRLQFLENEAFKAKLPTLLQSPDAPSTFYSWGGGVMRAQADTGALRPIGAQMDAAWQARVNAAALDAFRYQDKIWGAPHQLAVMGIYYNKAMFQKAGVAGEQIKTWDDLLGAVKALKAAGIVPIAVGGGDKWPIMHWWAYLVVRAGGRAALADATAGKNGGFSGAPFLAASEAMKQLADLKPFQDGYLAATF